MQPNPLISSFSPHGGWSKEGLHAGLGNTADELAMAEGFEGGGGGVRDALRHTMGAGYLYQGRGNISKNIIKSMHENQNQILNDEAMEAWYAKGGPDYNAIVANLNDPSTSWAMTREGGEVLEDERKMADAHNNTLGSSGIFDGLSFEERYEKTKDMVKEQLEYYSKTGEFKKGLPVWSTHVENGVSQTKAKNQLDTLEKAEEDIIESRRMGILSDKGDLSNLEQTAEYQRKWREANSLNKIAKLEDDIEDYELVLKKLKKAGSPPESTSITETRLDQAKFSLEEERKRIETRGGLAKLKNVRGEFWFDEIMKEQEFLKAGNDWVLQ